MFHRILFGFMGIVFVCGCVDAVKNAKTESTKETKKEEKVYNRDEFKKLAIGKTTQELIDTFGKPYSTQSGGLSDAWYYRKRTIDPINGKVDSMTQVIIENGIVARVNF